MSLISAGIPVPLSRARPQPHGRDPVSYLEGRLVLWVASLLLALGRSVKAIAEHDETDPSMSLGTSSIGAIASEKSRSSVMLKLAC